MSNNYTTAHPTSTYSPHTNGQVGAQNQQSMDGRPAEYAQPGSSLPYPELQAEQASESSPADQAAGAQYPQAQETKFNPSATPTSDYGMTPSSARQAQFPNDYAQRTQQYADHRYQTAGGHPPNMAHASNPNIAAASPTYPQPPPHYSQQGHPDMGGYYQTPMYHTRPGEYPPPGYPPYQGHYPPPMMGGRPGPPGGGVPLSTVYSFVPIPGTHQQKRPRRRYEEIERMYKCGWNGCEKAYGTLNHLNAHVTMQAHGVKRTPEEFKEIRKEWKQRKKDEDSQRKQEDERRGVPHGDGQSAGSDSAQSSAGSYPQGPRQLPPLGYAPAGAQVPPQYPPQPVDGMAPQYSGAPVQSYYSPPQGYGGGPPQMYTQAHPPPNVQEHGVANST